MKYGFYCTDFHSCWTMFSEEALCRILWKSYEWFSVATRSQDDRRALHIRMSNLLCKEVERGRGLVLSLYRYEHMWPVLRHSLGAFAKIAKSGYLLIVSVCLSVCLSVRVKLCSHSTDLHEIWHLRFFLKNLWKNFQFHQSLTRITGILHQYLSTFVIISR